MESSERQNHWQVFISHKNSNEDGFRTRDAEIAAEIYELLEEHSISVFMSEFSLEQLGESEYKTAIDKALDVAEMMIVVGTSRENLESRWVRYEWDSFINDIISGIKPRGKVFTYIEKAEAKDLPRSLRQTQTFHHSEQGKSRLLRFVENAFDIPQRSQSKVEVSERRDEVSSEDSMSLLETNVEDSRVSNASTRITREEFADSVKATERLIRRRIRTGNIKIAIGVFLLIITGVGGLGTTISGDGQNIGIQTVIVLASLGLLSLFSGARNKKLAKLSRQYIARLTVDPFQSIDRLAMNIGSSPSSVKKNLQRVLKKGFFRNAYIDENHNRLVFVDLEGIKNTHEDS